MRAPSVSFIAAATFATLIVPLPAARAETFIAIVANVIDGDTFDYSDGTRIRLCGIDAPEAREAGFFESALALQSLIKGKTVKCVQVGDGTPCDGRSKPTNRDRVVAQCFVDGGDVAIPMVENGFACDWVKFSGGAYSGSPKGRRCVKQ